MNYRDFFLKLFGFSKPTMIQMLFRKLEIFYDKIYGLDFLSVRKDEQLGLDKNLISKGSPVWK